MDRALGMASLARGLRTRCILGQRTQGEYSLCWYLVGANLGYRNESGRVPGQQTNNRGELLVSLKTNYPVMLLTHLVQAVIRALEIIDEDALMLTVYSDSKYTIQCTFVCRVVPIPQLYANNV